MWGLSLFVTLCALLAHAGRARAAPDAPPPASVEALLLRFAAAEGADRKALIEQLARTGDPRLEWVFADFNEGSLYLWQGKVVACRRLETGTDGTKLAPLADPLTRVPLTANGKPVIVPVKELTEVSATRRERGFVRDALTLLRLTNPDPEARLSAVNKAGDDAVQETLPALQELAKTEPDSTVKRAIAESIALIQLAAAPAGDSGKDQRLAAARTLGELRAGRAGARLKELAAAEKDPAAAAVYAAAIHRIERWETIAQWAGNLFSGLSLGSILILMALGLSIIFGLMGVINMAHGSLMMIGAYATYATQQFFIAHCPESAFNWYFVTAIPISFLVTAIVGMLMEATVIRFLYGRPLDTLLATFGVSLILVQIVRVWVGDNTPVNSPTWLRGSYEIMQDVRLPYNRMFIIAFCIVCIALMYYIIERTRLGLLLRATTQNRTMAAALGVSTRRIDALTFGLGAGLAGLAGCALTQIGGVTPDMGDNYIVDSFLVVVTGGVGKLAGAIWTGAGLGMFNKMLEPFFGAVWAKVLILVGVIIFIQWKPSGLFPAKGRSADA